MIFVVHLTYGQRCILSTKTLLGTDNARPLKERDDDTTAMKIQIREVMYYTTDSNGSHHSRSPTFFGAIPSLWSL